MWVNEDVNYMFSTVADQAVSIRGLGAAAGAGSSLTLLAAVRPKVPEFHERLTRSRELLGTR
jgi:hypothetical protein